jgi:hypothetical protein
MAKAVEAEPNGHSRGVNLAAAAALAISRLPVLIHPSLIEVSFHS